MILYLFDIDGTLLHAHGAGREAFDAVLLEHHGLAGASEGVRYGGKTDGQIVDEIFQARLGRAATEAEHAAFIAAYLPKLRANLKRHGVDIIEGVAYALAWLATRSDARMGVATGNVREGAAAKLAQCGLDAWFKGEHVGGYACDSRHRAELVGAAIARGRASTEVREVVVVGDTIHDVAAARANGATVCAVATGTDTAEQLASAGADAVWKSLRELPTWHAARYGELV